MRKGWRGSVIGPVLTLFGALVPGAPGGARAADGPVRLTVELAWAAGADRSAPAAITMAMTEGQVI